MKGDTGGGNHHWALHLSWPLQLPQHAGNQVGIGLSQSHTGVAQGHIQAKQGVQHHVAQTDLAFACDHSSGWKKLPENLFYLSVGFLVTGFRVCHRIISSFELMAK